MSEKQKEILDRLGKLPAPLQDKFLDRIQGATMAMDVLAPAGAEASEENRKEAAQ